MSELDGFSVSLENFSGLARLFPLPDLVLFPHVLQPIHVFEPRYRESLEEALADDRLMAMATLAPGWEDDYEGRPTLYPYACLAKIVVANELENGSSNVLLAGIERIRIGRELPPRKGFREAEVSICKDLNVAEQDAEQAQLKRRLLDAVVRPVSSLNLDEEQVDHLLGNNLPLGMLVDIISYTIDIGVAQKEALLAELDIRRRAKMLLAHIETPVPGLPQLGTPEIVFPPSFSIN